MKVAVITENGATISQHFGRAPIYLVLTVEGGKVIDREKRVRAGGHAACDCAENHTDLASGERHGLDAESRHKHTVMAEAIADCQVLIAGGMGLGAYESLKSYNIKPIITDIEAVDKAVELYLEGKLSNLMERLH